MGKHGIIPPDDQLIALLDHLSQKHYDGLFAPGAPLYDQYRPPRWAVNKTLCRAHGLPPNRHGWRRLVQRLGLCKPVAERGVTWNNHVRDYQARQRISELPDTPLDWPHAQLHEIRSRDLAGMDAIVRQRPLLAWCIRTKRYVQTGVYTTFELR
ncbi:MAG: hypothetical protein DCC55_22450 [Chloroflexi bacterium]|nr:MAG: hypothetical protein DCC55_22450 [Chloroflexota bacterium]